MIKRSLPDAHADFVFSVAGEEFGFLLCVLLILLYLAIIGRVLYKVLLEKNPFIFLALAGLIFQFSLQTLVNMSSSLHLIPTKGMTLPFLSYGGSSLLASALGFGIILGLTRKRLPIDHG